MIGLAFVALCMGGLFFLLSCAPPKPKRTPRNLRKIRGMKTKTYAQKMAYIKLIAAEHAKLNKDHASAMRPLRTSK